MANNALDEFVVVASHDGRIQAIDARDGQTRWTQVREHPFAGLVLAQVGHEVVAASGDGYVCLLALDDGAVQWEISLPTTGQITTPTSGIRVAAHQHLAAVQLGGVVFALDIDDGHTVWEARPTPAARQWWLLAVGEEHIYTLQMGRFSSGLYSGSAAPLQFQPDALPTIQPARLITTAFSAWDGTPQWFVEESSAVEPPWDASSSLVEEDGVVYAYGHQGLHAFEAASGVQLWTCDTIADSRVGALALGHDTITVAANGYVGVHRRDTGAVIWSKTAAKREDGYFEWFDTPVVCGDAVFVGRSASGSDPSGFHIESYEVETGTQRWVWPGAVPSAAVQTDVSWRYRGAGTTLYVPSRDVLWAIQAADGRERWNLSYDFRSEFSALLAVARATA